jgi:PAS domain S-box-containing protein
MRDAPSATDLDFRILVEAVEDYAIFRLDKDGFVTTWNTGAQRAKGYTSSEIIGRHYAVFFTPEDQSNGKPQEILSRVNLEGRFADEGWRVRKDKSRFWASVVLTAVRDENGQLAGFIKITRDLSEQRAAHETLRENEGWIRMLIDSLSDYAIFTLDYTGHVTSWNMGAERAKGYTKEEILGQPYSIFFKPEDQANNLPAEILRTAIREGHFEGEGWRVRKDGSEIRAHGKMDATGSQREA